MSDSNYISDYESALGALSARPDDEQVMHAAVLALARAGALEFALTEYARFGLDVLRHHEDIQSLGGRLLKDLALASAGETRTEYARQSSEKYEQAFQDTGGYYSGVNAATMALIANVPHDIIKTRAQTLLKHLPPTKALSAADKYFIEASRAECSLLLDADEDAETALRAAITHDPQNYVAHASTLKQFRMILKHKGQPQGWLNLFNPPQAVHYAGHIFKRGKTADALSASDCAALKISISDHIQKHDIGFGYGALAAGSDILIAEALIEDGAALSVVLPCAAAKFCERSVAPFGKHWVARFDALMKQAADIQITGSDVPWPFNTAARLASRVAMGMAAMQADNLKTSCAQLLVWDKLKISGSIGTAQDARHWSAANREQIIIPYPGQRAAAQNRPQNTDDTEILTAVIAMLPKGSQSKAQVDSAETDLRERGFVPLGGSPGTYVATFVQALDAAKIADGLPHKNGQIYMDFVPASAPQITETVLGICSQLLPRVAYASQAVAAVLHAMHGDDVLTTYAGLAASPSVHTRHIFTCRLKMS